jgi:hypothetical protein
MLPCQFTHQNVEGAIYCSECHPNGPDFDQAYLPSRHIPSKVTLVVLGIYLKGQNAI